MPSRLTVVLVSLLLATPVIIFWLWLMILPTSVTIQCHEECKCQSEGYKVNCSSSGLKSIPAILPKYILQLVLDGNNITFLAKDNFLSKGLDELRIIDANFCEIKKLEVGAFNGLSKLTNLSMHSNEISEITPGTFEKLFHLENLHLANNRIKRLEADIFYGLFSLKYIYLEGNKLQTLHPDTFVELPNLQRLYLSKNSGLQIPTDSYFINSLSLKQLEISGCNISSVPDEKFVNVSELEWLDLSDNNLKELNIHVLKSLPKLSKLYLNGNPLQCDCVLQEVWLWCKDYKIQTEYKGKGPECDTPSEMKGMGWGMSEKVKCALLNPRRPLDYNITRYSYKPIEVKDTEIKMELNTETLIWKTVSSFVDNYKLPISAVLFIFGTTGNVIIIIIITCNKDMRTVPNMYILNLAISDIIYLTVLFSVAWSNSIMSLGGDIMCVFITFCFRMSVGLSAYSIAVLSFQRYRVTVYPLQVFLSSQTTWRATGVTICGLWIVAALFAIPSARTKDFCVFSLFLLVTSYYQRVAIFRLLVSCVLPLCVIAFCYVMTYRHLLKSRFSLSETQNVRHNTRENTAKIVLGLTVVFLFSYVPVYVYETFLFLSENSEKTFAEVFEEWDRVSNLALILPILDLFLSLNSCLNPVALFCTSLAFRRHFKHHLTCLCKVKSSSADFKLTTRM